MLFAVPSSNLPALATTVQAGSAADLQRLVNEALTALIVASPTHLLVGFEIAGAGNGSQFEATLLTAATVDRYAFVNSSGTPIAPAALSTFDDVTDRSVILFAQGGTAEEASAALADAIAEVKSGSPPISGATQQYAYEFAGSSNGAQWLAATVLFNGVALP